MIEPIKDLYQYLGIKFTYNKRELFEVNTIVNISKQPQKKVTNRTGPRPDPRGMIPDDELPGYVGFNYESKNNYKFSGWLLPELEYLLKVKESEYNLAGSLYNKVTISKEILDIKDAIAKFDIKLKKSDSEILNKVDLLINYLKTTSNEVGLVKGIIFNKTKLVTSPTYEITSEDLIQIKYENIEYLVEVYRVVDNKIVKKLEKKSNRQVKSLTNSSSIIEGLLPAILKIRLLSVTNSVDLFGLSDERNKILEYYKEKNNSFIDNYAFYITKSKKLNNTTYTALINNTENKAIKFLLQDLQIVNPELKGYTLQKFNHYKVNSKVRLKESGIEGIIISIKNNESSKRINRTNLRRLDVISIRTNTGIVTVRAKNISLIEDKLKEELLSF